MFKQTKLIVHVSLTPNWYDSKQPNKKTNQTKDYDDDCNDDDDDDNDNNNHHHIIGNLVKDHHN